MNNNIATINILLCGVGGQGILTMAEIICLVAAVDGYHVKKSEVHGMAQRGGSVESHVRFGKEVMSPLIPYGGADYLVPLYPQEHVRMKGFLKNEGVDFLPYLENVMPISKDPKYINSAMLGVIASHLTLKSESWENVFNIMFANKNLKENLDAFRKGKSIRVNK